MMTHGRSSIIFTLSGQLGNTEDNSSPFDTTNAIKVDSDGSVYEGDSIDGAALSYVQVDGATDWLRPANDPTRFFVRYSNVDGTFTATPGAVDTAIALTVDRVWTVNRTGPGSSIVTFDLEILDTDQATILAGPSAYRVWAENNVA